MKQNEVIEQAFGMPLTSPCFPRGPYRFTNREFLIIDYETDLDKLQQLVPEPLEVTEPIVKFEFIAMPDSTGFGSYTEAGQVIPVRYKGEAGNYTLAMYLDDHPPIAGGREIWGFPKKLAKPSLTVHKETLVGTLKYDGQQVALATMGYKYQTLDQAKVLQSMQKPGYLLKIIPHVDGNPRICELVRYTLADVTVKGAWSGPARLDLTHHVMAPVADLPIHRIVSATHILTDLTLPYGTVAYDYLA